ncbi:MAG: hypothetical protein IJ715_03065 [Bacilli bacterium]|nr:hypothetical protein [Bacilli bacterium]
MPNESEELDRSIINKRYNYYLKTKTNNSEHANMILEKIKNGYEPNDADVFELYCDDEEKITEYREMFDIKQRVKGGQISEKDYEYLIKKIGINDKFLEEALREKFTSSGKLVEKYDTNISKR